MAVAHGRKQIEANSHAGKTIAVFTSGGDSQVGRRGEGAVLLEISKTFFEFRA
jgi:hypothetical protein